MKILAIDTSTEACSVALAIDDNVNERFELVQQRHSECLLPMVQALLAEASLGLSQLDAIAFSRGPGSFTGLRIGAGVTQGLAFGADLPVVAISSLAALAQGQNMQKILAAFDARMGQVYYGAYRRNAQGLVELWGTESVVAPDAVSLPMDSDSDWVGAGNGWDQYTEQLLTGLKDRVKTWLPQCYPHAKDIITLAKDSVARRDVIAPQAAIPVYVRDDVAKKAFK